MKKMIVLLAVLSLLLAGCELPGFLNEPSIPATDPTKELGTPIWDENGNRIGTAILHYDENHILIKEVRNFDDGSAAVFEYKYDDSGVLYKFTLT